MESFHWKPTLETNYLTPPTAYNSYAVELTQSNTVLLCMIIQCQTVGYSDSIKNRVIEDRQSSIKFFFEICILQQSINQAIIKQISEVYYYHIVQVCYMESYRVLQVFANKLIVHIRIISIPTSIPTKSINYLNTIFFMSCRSKMLSRCSRLRRA